MLSFFRSKYLSFYQRNYLFISSLSIYIYIYIYKFIYIYIDNLDKMSLEFTKPRHINMKHIYVKVKEINRQEICCRYDVPQHGPNDGKYQLQRFPKNLLKITSAPKKVIEEEFPMHFPCQIKNINYKTADRERIRGRGVLREGVGGKIAHYFSRTLSYCFHPIFCNFIIFFWALRARHMFAPLQKFLNTPLIKGHHEFFGLNSKDRKNTMVKGQVNPKIKNRQH